MDVPNIVNDNFNVLGLPENLAIVDGHQMAIGELIYTTSGHPIIFIDETEPNNPSLANALWSGTTHVPSEFHHADVDGFGSVVNCCIENAVDGCFVNAADGDHSESTAYGHHGFGSATDGDRLESAANCDGLETTSVGDSFESIVDGYGFHSATDGDHSEFAANGDCLKTTAVGDSSETVAVCDRSETVAVGDRSGTVAVRDPLESATDDVHSEFPANGDCLETTALGHRLETAAVGDRSESAADGDHSKSAASDGCSVSAAVGHCLKRAIPCQQRTHLNEKQKNQILAELYRIKKTGRTVKSISEQFKVGRNYISQLLKRMKDGQGFNRKKGSGRKTVMTKEKVSKLDNFLEEAKYDATFENLSAHLGVSAPAIWHHMQRNHYRKAGKFFRPTLSQSQKAKRLEWAKMHCDDQFRTTVDIDEKEMQSFSKNLDSKSNYTSIKIRKRLLLRACKVLSSIMDCVGKQH